eukprot:888368-Pelagomonas_calceolata.AAC.4
MQIHSISGQPGPDRIRKHGGKQAKSSLRESSLKSLLQTKHAGFMNGSFVCLGVTDCDHAHLTRVCCMYGIFKGHFGSGESWVRGTPGKGKGLKGCALSVRPKGADGVQQQRWKTKCRRCEHAFPGLWGGHDQGKNRTRASTGRGQAQDQGKHRTGASTGPGQAQDRGKHRTRASTGRGQAQDQGTHRTRARRADDTHRVAMAGAAAGATAGKKASAF